MQGSDWSPSPVAKKDKGLEEVWSLELFLYQGLRICVVLSCGLEQDSEL